MKEGGFNTLDHLLTVKYEMYRYLKHREQCNIFVRKRLNEFDIKIFQILAIDNIYFGDM